MFEGVWEKALIGAISALLISIIFAPLMRSKKESANLSNPGGITPLMQAVMRTDPGKITKLIKDGADIDAQDDEGMTALMHAVFHDYYDAAEILFKAGANLTIKNSVGISAVDIAEKRGLEDFVNLFNTKI